jgi:hypothetical protein
LLTVAEVFGRIDDLTRFVEIVVEQDLEATADSEDALVVKAIRDAAHHAVGEVTTLGSDPYSAVTIPYSKDDEHEPPGIVEEREVSET